MAAGSGDLNLGHTFYPGLQGLRGIAAFTIFCNHYMSIVFPSRTWYWASAGVDLFFVLSGFLITGILLETRGKPDYFRRFYRNRAYRIFPLFYAFWALLLVTAPVLHPLITRYNLAFAVYLGNLVLLKNMAIPAGIIRFAIGHGNTSLVIGHFWSLTVEEHFYLIWPLVVWFARTRRRVAWIAAIGVIGTLLLRCLLFHELSQSWLDRGFLYFSTFSRFDSILIGALLSCWMAHTGASVTVRRKVAPWLIWIPVLLLVCGQYLLPAQVSAIGTDWREQTYGFTLVGLAAAGVLLTALDEQSWLFRSVTWRPVMWLGLVSYSFYVLHYIPVNIWSGYLHRLAPYHLQTPMLVVVFAVTCVASLLSYRFIEAPFLRLKNRSSLGMEKGGKSPAEGNTTVDHSSVDGTGKEKAISVLG